MKLISLHDGSLKPRAGSSLSKPIPVKPDIINIKYAVPQLTPVGEKDASTALDAKIYGQTMSLNDVSNLDRPIPLKPNSLEGI